MDPDKTLHSPEVMTTGSRSGGLTPEGHRAQHAARGTRRLVSLAAGLCATAAALGGWSASSAAVDKPRSAEQAGSGNAGVRVGEVVILPVYDGVGRVLARDTVRRTSVRGDPWGPHQGLLKPGGVLEYPMGGFLVLDGARRILVDAGNGHAASRDETTGQFMQSLEALGYAPEDITDVLFTHLHSDHTGWAVQQGQAVFPNATYRVHDADWRAFGGARSRLSPVTGQLRTFDADVRISPSVTTRYAPGHTPGTTVFVVASGGERALLIGDIAHSPAQFADRDWYTVWDSDRAAATAARNALADEAVASGDLVIPSHFPGMGGGHVLDGPRRFVMSGQEQAPR